MRNGNDERDPEGARMSEVAALGRVFFDAGDVFKDMGRKPRFVLGLMAVLVCVTVMNYVIVGKVGFERVLRDQMDKSPVTRQMSSSEKDALVAKQNTPLMTVVRTVSPPLALVILTLLGSLYYFAAANAMGGESTFAKSLSVWVYSSIPPTIVLFVGNMVVAALKAADSIDVSDLQGGLFKANAGILFDAGGALGALISSLDLFAVWGWVLASIGLQKTANVSAATSWGIVGLLALFGIAVKVVGAMFFRG